MGFVLVFFGLLFSVIYTENPRVYHSVKIQVLDIKCQAEQTAGKTKDFFRTIQNFRIILNTIILRV